MAFRAGDKIVSIDGKKTANWLDVSQAVSDEFGHDFSLTFERGGKNYSALYRASDMGSIKDVRKHFGIEPADLWQHRCSIALFLHFPPPKLG